MEKTKIIVTGGSGFIGSRLIELLHESIDCEILNLDLKSPKRASNLARHISIDIRDDFGKIMDDFMPDYLLNLAAETTVKDKSLKDYTSNIKGVDNVVSMCNNCSSLKKVAFFSTQYVYQGYKKWSGYDQYKPFTIYGESKKIGEEIVIDKCDVSYLILRPTNIWGENNEVYVNGLFDVMRKGYYYHPNKKNVSRSYGYIDNICIQTIDLLFSEKDNATFYLSDVPVNLFEWVGLIQKEINGNEVKTLPYFIFKMAAIIGDILGGIGLSFPMNSTRLKNMTRPNPVPIEDTLANTRPMPVSVKEGVERTIKWYKSNH